MGQIPIEDGLRARIPRDVVGDVQKDVFLVCDPLQHGAQLQVAG